MTTNPNNDSRTSGNWLSNMEDHARRGRADDFNALHRIIEEDMKVPKELPNLLAFTHMDTKEESLALASLAHRGIRRLTKTQQQELNEGKMSFMEAPYPVQLAGLVASAAKSVEGRGMVAIVNAITGVMTLGRGERERNKDSGAPAVHVHNN